MRNVGERNERRLINFLNNKTIKDLPDHFKIPIMGMTYKVTDNCVIQAEKVSNFIGCKTDFELTLKGYIINISVKQGHFPSLHQEEFKSFIEFLEGLGISKRTIKILKFYHFRDGTLDGINPKFQMGFEQFREKFKKYIAEASEELSQEYIVRAIVYRGIIKGRNPRRQEIDYLYYGNEDKGIFLHKKELLEHTHKYGREKYTALHFGPIVYTSKYPPKVAKDGTIIHYAVLRWPIMEEDVYKMRNDIDKSKLEKEEINNSNN